MKRNLFTLALLGMVASISACKDDDVAPPAEDQFSYNDQAYEVKSGAIIDYGPVAAIGSDDTHYAYAFLVSDGTMSFPQNEDPTLTGATYVLTTFLYSKNTSNFSGGTFNWVNAATATEADLLNKDLMVMGMLSLDSNNDGTIDESDNMDYYATAGNVVVDGSGSNYSITYALTFNGKQLTGNYEGPFTIIQGDLGGDGHGEGAFSYMSDNLVANSGLIQDFGGTDVDEDGTSDFYNYDFYITDGVFNGDGDDISLDGEPTYFVYAELYSASSNSFEAGTFEFIPDYEITNLDDFFFSYADIEIDLNGDGDVDDADEFAIATGGTITVTGSNRNYNISFTLELDNGQTLRGNYDGAFSYVDNREGGRRAPFTSSQRTKTSKQRLQLR